MARISHAAGLGHLHHQIQAAGPLILPEYQYAFEKFTKLLELQMIMEELTQNHPDNRFRASSISQGGEGQHPCDFAAFIQAMAPVCNETERIFLHQLQNTWQTIQMMEQISQLQNLKPKNEQEVSYGSGESGIFTEFHESGKGHQSE